MSELRHGVRLTSPRPVYQTGSRVYRLGRVVRGRAVCGDPLPGTPTSGWGWRCETCGAADDEFATSWSVIEAAEYHARTHDER